MSRALTCLFKRVLSLFMLMGVITTQLASWLVVEKLRSLQLRSDSNLKQRNSQVKIYKITKI